jgi:hypothetical protein
MRLSRLQPPSAKGCSQPSFRPLAPSIFLMPGEEPLRGESPLQGSRDHHLGLRFKGEN